MPLPLAAMIATNVASDPAKRKLIMRAAIAIPVALAVLLVAVLGAVTSMMNMGSGGAAAEEYCRSTANGAYGLDGTAQYEGGGEWLMKFVRSKNLNFYHARIVWALGMRESGGSPEQVSNTGDYGTWQINQSNGEYIKKTIGPKYIDPGTSWNMEDLGKDPNKNFAVMWFFSNRGEKFMSWGLAANQPTNGVKFDWLTNYATAKGPNGGPFIEEVAPTAEANYIKFYNQFPDAAKKLGVTFNEYPRGVPPTAKTAYNTPFDPSMFTDPASSSPSPQETNSSQNQGGKPKPSSSSTAKPNSSSSPPVYGPVAPSPSFALPPLINPDGTLNLFPYGVGSPSPNPTPKATTAQVQYQYRDKYVGTWIPSATVKAQESYGSTTVSGHPILYQSTGDLQTFTVAGRDVTVAKQWVPTFRSFLYAWQLSSLGQGRFDLRPGPLDSYVPKEAGAAAAWSDHWGYAVDIRYDVLLPDNKRHMTDDEIQAVRVLLKRFPQLGWGGDYQTKIDEMHFFIKEGAKPGDAIGTAVPAYILNNKAIDPILAKDGPLEQALAAWPYTINEQDNISMEEGVDIIRSDQTAEDSGMWIIDLGSKEALFEEKITQPSSSSSSASPAPSPSPTVKLLDPEIVNKSVKKILDASGGKPVYWIAPFNRGPSQQIVHDALKTQNTKFGNLNIIIIPDDPSTGYIDDKGKLTEAGSEYLAGILRNGVENVQPAYTEKAECQEALFGGGTYEPIRDGKFSDRTDISVPNAQEIIITAKSYIGKTNAPCGTCYQECDRLAGLINRRVPIKGGVLNSGYKSAKQHWEVAQSDPTQWGPAYPGDTSVPPGAIVFFDGHPTYGHVATYIGDGWVVSNYDGPDGYGVYAVPLKDMAASYGYLGWAMPVYPGGF